MHDYLNDDLAHLKLPASDGRHQQLTTQQLNDVLKTVIGQEIDLFHRLRIGNKRFKGAQCVYSKPALGEGMSKRADYVFTKQPKPFQNGAQREGDLDLEACWFGKVELLLQFQMRSPHSSQPVTHSCALINYLFDLTIGEPAWFRDVAGIGTKLVYQPDPANSVFYVVPVSDILGRLPLVPAFDGKIPRFVEGKELNQKDHFSHGTLSRSSVFFINSWAMRWPLDYPIN